MGKPKKYLIKSVNFGEVGNLSRIIVEKYEKLYGKQAFSSLMRKLVLIYLSDKPEFDEFKIQKLLFERQELIKQKKEVAKKLNENAEQLEKKNFDISKIFLKSKKKDKI